MSTNYYWQDNCLPPRFRNMYKKGDDISPYIHIGHSSAAGLYCTYCGTTFCEAGSSLIHTSAVTIKSKCPSCGRGKDSKYVVPAYSFTVTLDEHYRYLQELSMLFRGSQSLVIDEYGKPLTVKEMLNIIDGAKFRFQVPGYWT